MLALPAVYVLFIVGMFAVRSCETPIAGYLLGWACAITAAIVTLVLRMNNDEDDNP